MKVAVFLSALLCSALAAPNLLEGGVHPPGAHHPEAPALYTLPAIDGSAAAPPAAPSAVYSPGAIAGDGAAGAATAAGAAAAGGASAASGAASGPVVGIVRDDRVVDDTGSYSFDVAGEDGTARQESGAPLPEGGISQTGSYSYTQPDGTVFELKYVADANGFQPESSALPELPQFVLDQIEFAKNNPEPEGADGAAAAGGAAAAAGGAVAALGTAAGAAAGGAAAGGAAAAGGVAVAAPGSSYLPPSPVGPASTYFPPSRR